VSQHRLERRSNDVAGPTQGVFPARNKTVKRPLHQLSQVVANSTAQGKAPPEPIPGSAGVSPFQPSGLETAFSYLDFLQDASWGQASSLSSSSIRI
jgi:hypothetical protein